LEVVLSNPLSDFTLGWLICDFLGLLYEFQESDNLFLHSLGDWAVIHLFLHSHKFLTNFHEPGFKFLSSANFGIFLNPSKDFHGMLISKGGKVECSLIFSSFRHDQGLNVFLDLIEIFEKMSKGFVAHPFGV